LCAAGGVTWTLKVSNNPQYPMKKVLSVLVAAALCTAAFAQAPAPENAPQKNIISSFRVWVKEGHTDAFKAAISAHAKKFHKGDVGWRVGEVMSGPDGGPFQVNEGPTSWTALDDRGDLGAEHTADWEKNIQPHIEKITPESYARFSQTLSSVKMDAWSNKVAMVHYDVRVGRLPLAMDVMKRWKAIWEKRDISFATWTSAWSGSPRFSVAFRLKNGWKDFDMDGPSSRDAANAIWGTEAYDRLMADMAMAFERSSSELVNYDAKLGSN
jgi:hypothetical protein